MSDNPYDIRTFVRSVRPPRGFGYVGTALVAAGGRALDERAYFSGPADTTRGVNEAGLALTGAVVFTADSTPRAVAHHGREPVTDLVLRTCASVDEAVACFEEHARRISPAVNHLIADAGGKVARVEIGDGKFALHSQRGPTAPGWLVAVNCFESLDVPVQQTALLTCEDGNNGCRHARGILLANETATKGDSISVTDITAILSDHEHIERDPVRNSVTAGWGYSICNHGTLREEPSGESRAWGTVSAEILDTQSRTLWFAYGWPCGGHPDFADQLFQERSWGFFLPFKVPHNDMAARTYTTVDGGVMSGSHAPPVQLAR